MALSLAADRRSHALDPLEYAPGACNIGPAEIARRRRSGHAAALLTVLTLTALVVLDAPPALRLLVALPAAGAAAGYLQAWLRFCVAFGFRGIFNFGALGRARSVIDHDAQRRDRRRAAQIGIGALAIGVTVGALAAALPL